jgi:hypothetical protein
MKLVRYADRPDLLDIRFDAGALATLLVEDGIGTHVEPNVWVLHRV